MSVKTRDEIVGKRFLSVKSPNKLKVNRISEWDWKAGVVRAVSQRDYSDPDVTVLVEYDSAPWERREWVHVHDVFHVFLVESQLVWAPRPPPDPDKHRDSCGDDATETVMWPALTFSAIVDRCGLKKAKRPVEFLIDKKFLLVEPASITPHKDPLPVSVTTSSPSVTSDPAVTAAIRAWNQYQDGQQILQQTPSVLIGYRMQVYRAEGTTQWYTAVVKAYNDSTRELALTDDTVLEEHYEDPAMLQMMLIGDGVVDAILRGEDSGVRPSRTRRSNTSAAPPPAELQRHAPKRSAARSPAVKTLATPRVSPAPSPLTTTPKPSPASTPTPSSSSSTSGKRRPAASGGSQPRNRRVRRPLSRDSSLDDEDTDSTASSSRCSTPVSAVQAAGSTSQGTSIIKAADKRSRAKGSVLRSSAKGKRLARSTSNSPVPAKRKDAAAAPAAAADTPTTSRPRTDAPPVSTTTSKPTETQAKRSCGAFVKKVIEPVEQAATTPSSSSLAKLGTQPSSSPAASAATLATKGGVKRQERSKSPSSLSTTPKKSCVGDEDSSSAPSTPKSADSPLSLSSSGKRREVRVSLESLSPARLRGASRSGGADSPSSRQQQQQRSQGNKLSPLSKSNKKSGSSGLKQHDLPPSPPKTKAKPTCKVKPQVTVDKLTPVIKRKDPPVLPSLHHPADPKIKDSDPFAFTGEEEDTHKSRTSLSSRQHAKNEAKLNAAEQPVIVQSAIVQLSRPSNKEKVVVAAEKDSLPLKPSVAATEKIVVAGEKSSSEVKESKKTPSPVIPRPLSKPPQPPPPPPQDEPQDLSKKASPTKHDVAGSSSSSSSPKQHVSDMHYKKSQLLTASPVVTELKHPAKSQPLTQSPTATSGKTDHGQQQHRAGLPHTHHPPLPAVTTDPHSRPPSNNTSHHNPNNSMNINLNQSVTDQLARRAKQGWSSAAADKDLDDRGSPYSTSSSSNAPAASTSPLVLDKSRPVEPYRDPELLKKDSEMRSRLSAPQPPPGLPPSRPPASSSAGGVYPASLAALSNSGSGAAHTSAPISLLAAAHGYPSAASLAALGLPQVPPHLPPSALQGHVHHSAMAAAQLQHLQAMQAQQSAQLFQHAALNAAAAGGGAFPPHSHSALQTRHLELLWTQKFPSLSVPPAWMLHQYQDELVRDVNVVHMAAAAKLEHEREMREREAAEKQRERDERERREREDRERRERREQEERQKMAAAEAAERHERERQREKEREIEAKEREMRVERERILYESKHAVDAVNQHFQESLSRLAQHKVSPGSQQPRSGSASPPRGGGDGLVTEDQLREALAKFPQGHPNHAEAIRLYNLYYQQSSQDAMMAQRRQQQQQQQQHHQQQKSSGGGGKDQPNFSLYGYPAGFSQHVQYISQDKLYAQGLRGGAGDSNHGNPPPPSQVSPNSTAKDYSTKNRSSGGDSREQTQQQQQQQGVIVSGGGGGKPSPRQQQQHQSHHHPHHPHHEAPAGGSITLGTSSRSSSNQHSPGSGGAAVTTVAGRPPAASPPATTAPPPPSSIHAYMASLSHYKPAGANSSQSQISPGSNKRSEQQQQQQTPRKRTKSECSGSQHPGSSPLASPKSTSSAAAAPSSSYIDTFRSFVESAVQSAFYQDQELGGRLFNSTTAGSSANKTQQTPPKVASAGTKPTTTTSVLTSPTTMTTSPATTVASGVAMAAAAGLHTTGSHHQPANQHVPAVSRPGPVSTPGGASSIMDTIARVPNGVAMATASSHTMDTDSDTLSAPSPPPPATTMAQKPAVTMTTASTTATKHTKAHKKAWLQRYTDDTTTTVATGNDSKTDVKMEVKVESPAKSDASTSNVQIPVSVLSKDLNGGGSGSRSPMATVIKTDIKDEVEVKMETSSSPIMPTTNRLKKDDSESTTSASETETMTNDTTKGSKKKIKRKSKPEPRVATPSGEEAFKTEAETTPPAAKKAKLEVKQEVFPVLPMSLKDESGSEQSPVPVLGSNKGKRKGKKGRKDGEGRRVVSDCEQKLADKMKRKKKDKNAESPSSILAAKPLNSACVATLKKTQEAFLQEGSCSEVTPKLMKCRECKMTPNQRNQKLPNIFCRFYAFRRLKYSTKGHLTIAGFSEPADADADDIELWYPRWPLSPPVMDTAMAKYVISNVGDRFCELVEQEKEAMSWVRQDVQIAWKRAVQGVREMCDVCDTTLFNMHWVCHKCGFVACIDCYRLRKKKGAACADSGCKTCGTRDGSGGGGQRWLTCSANRQSHEPDRLMITQIIPSDALWVLGRMIHEVREKWNIAAQCPCGRSNIVATTTAESPAKEEKPALVNGSASSEEKEKLAAPTPASNSAFSDGLSPLNLLAEAAAQQRTEPPQKPDAKGPCSTLRDLLTRQGAGNKAGPAGPAAPPVENKPTTMSLDDIIQKSLERSKPELAGLTVGGQVRRRVVLKHYIPKNGQSLLGRDTPIPAMSLTETAAKYPGVKHSWLDNGRLLRLVEPRCQENIGLFQQCWRRGQPVIVSNCDKAIDRELWKPATFSREFGHIENDLVNCFNHVVLVGHKMKTFWDGFEKIAGRLKDSKDRAIILKLKDWPSTEDFAEVLPSRFQDLMGALPLPEYTHRNGIFNLACRLPEFFVKPDLGPKMYNAYGSSLTPRSGSTNLHLDISDAVNLMMYVGIPEDDIGDAERAAALRAMDEAGCCEFTKARVREAGEKPGALWHIYDPEDADKIRDLLNKVAKEKGEKIEPHHDPIHDQSWYLDESLRARLLSEYQVQGYTIVQCLGDAVFIPAGAPHQVRNLHSCIKCAEDFVSPENLNYCFRMTQEFRHLSDTHSNHEDKLQVKNIIYHAVKDAIAVLQKCDPV